MGRLLLIATLVGGCSFVHGAGNGDGTSNVDAPAQQHPDAAKPPPDAVLPPDACPDADHDGVCDAVDTWPCGPLPTAPTANVSDKPMGANLTMSTIDISTQGQLVVATAGASLSLSMHFTLSDNRCPMCIDQVEVGWMQGTTGPRSGCAWDGGVPNPGMINQNVNSFTITAPTTPGQYDLRTNIGQNTSCGNGSWWVGEVPAAATTIAILCVH
jgi:hypothetical protein